VTPGVVLVPDGPDAGLVWHCGAPLREQRRMSGGAGVLWLANREVLEFDVPRWELEGVPGLRLSRDGLWAHADPGWGQALVPRLRASLGLGVWRRRDLTVVWRGARLPDPTDAVASNLSPVPDGVEWIVEASDMGQTCTQTSGSAPVGGSGAAGCEFVPLSPGDVLLPEVAAPVGMWAYEALRIAQGVPRVGMDVPLTPGAWVESGGFDAAGLSRLLLEADDLPPVGAPITAGGAVVGRVGSSAQHYTWGPVALALLEPGLPPDTPLRIGPGVAATVWV